MRSSLSVGLKRSHSSIWATSTPDGSFSIMSSCQPRPTMNTKISQKVGDQRGAD